ncbi:MAG: bifunctional oligoribonuclease/PAP phosphatase NrnA [Chloroflexota bacterium]
MESKTAPKKPAEKAEGSQPVILELLAAHGGERHLIVLQDYPDPDAIASAFAHQLIAASFNVESDVIYAGRISHQQNVALVKLLGLDLIHYEGELPAPYDGAIFVDNQGTTCEVIVKALQTAAVPTLLVVDHHQPQERLQPAVSDVRPVGATSTLYAEYLQQGALALNRTEPSHVLVATALMHGILTDTGGLIQATAADFQAAAFLSPFVDNELLVEIMNQARSKHVMEIIRLALGNRVVAEGFSMAGVGYLRPSDRDAVPQAADFLLTEENVHTAIVYGIVSGENQAETLVGSLRTAKITLSPDEFIKEVFGKNGDGRYYGGGKALAGGFEVPVGFLSGGSAATYQDLKWQVFDGQVKQKLFHKIGVEPKAMNN